MKARLVVAGIGVAALVGSIAPAALAGSNPVPVTGTVNQATTLTLDNFSSIAYAAGNPGQTVNGTQSVYTWDINTNDANGVQAQIAGSDLTAGSNTIPVADQSVAGFGGSFPLTALSTAPLTVASESAPGDLSVRNTFQILYPSGAAATTYSGTYQFSANPL